MRYIGILFGIAVVVGLYYINRPFTASDVQSYTWVPDTCPVSVEYCIGIHSFDSQDCLIKDDGHIYFYDQAVAKFLEGEHPPFIRESAPRTGGTFKFMDLVTGDICSFDTTD